MPHAKSSSDRLSLEQIECSKRAQAQGLHASVKPAELFGPVSSGFLAAQVYRDNPVLFRELQKEYAFQTLQEKRPPHEPGKPFANDLLLDF